MLIEQLPISINSIFALVSGLAAGTAGFVALMRYLQLGESITLKKENALLSHLQSKLDDLEKLQKIINEKDRAKFLSEITSMLEEETATDILEKIETKVAKRYVGYNSLTIITKQTESTIRRLVQELYSLTKRSNLNLSIGILTTLTGLVLLGLFVIRQPTTDMSQFIIGFIPRISLVILIEIFAYFFLRLYKVTLSEIKYFQNEITSIEFKFLALTTMAATTGKEDQLKVVIEHLAKTERNFILDKGQSTIDLERGKLDQKTESLFIEKLSNLINKKL